MPDTCPAAKASAKCQLDKALRGGRCFLCIDPKNELNCGHKVSRCHVFSSWLSSSAETRATTKAGVSLHSGISYFGPDQYSGDLAPEKRTP